MPNTPQFLYEAFVDQTSLNTAFSTIATATHKLGSESTFFIPGVISPSSMTFGFNSNLIVTVNTPSPFECMFSTGAIAGGNGNTDGSISTGYNVDLSGFVPSVGSRTVYIVATYSTVQQTPTVIVGAPAGHPDYSASFIPYVGYQNLLDTLTITGTLTVPDNKTYIELARTTLVAGQTSITSVDTSHQIAAALNVSSILNGDVTGTLLNNIVNRSSAATFVANNVNVNGALNVTGSVGVNGGVAAGGSVSSLTSVTTTGFLSAIGEVFGANANASNAAVMLGQLAGSAINLIGPNSTAHFTVPIWTGSALTKVIIQFGSYQPTAFIQANTTYTIDYPIRFPNLLGMVIANQMGGNPNGSMGTIVNFPNDSSFQWTQGSTGAIAIYWLAIGN